MKPIHLNLASRPYRDYRPVYAVVVVLSLLTAFLMLNNIETYYRYIHETQGHAREDRAGRGADAREKREREDSRAGSACKGLDLAHARRSRRSFINAKLAERAFSWSRLLDELESVLADDVRLLSVAPAVQRTTDRSTSRWTSRRSRATA